MSGHEIETAKALLYGPGGLNVTNIGISPGSDPGTTPAQIAAQITTAVTAMEKGDYEIIEDFDD